LDFVSEPLNERHDRTGLQLRPCLDGWLRDHALHAAAMHTGRTFVWHAGDAVVRAYFTLAAHLVAREEISRRLARGSPRTIPAILLARLALARDLQGQGRGAELLRDALSRAVAADRQAAARLVVVDAVDDQSASFSRHHGFKPIAESSRRLVQKMCDIELVLAR